MQPEGPYAIRKIDDLVQLAVARGAAAVATASERSHRLLRDLGALPVGYGPGPADRVRAAAPRSVSAAVDFVGTDEALDVSVEMVADRRRIASVTSSPRHPEAGIELLGHERVSGPIPIRPLP